MGIFTHNIPTEVQKLILDILDNRPDCHLTADRLVAQGISFGWDIYCRSRWLLEIDNPSDPARQKTLADARKLAEFNKKYFSDTHPQYPRILCHTAQVYSAMKEDDLAEDCLKKALILVPSSPVIRTMMGNHLSNQRRHSEAKQFYEQALLAEPNKFVTLLSLIRCLRQLKDYPQVLAKCQNYIPLYEARARDSSKSALDLGKLYNEAANAAFRLPQPDLPLVLDYADRMIRFDPTDHGGYWHRCRAYCCLMDIPNALIALGQHRRYCTHPSYRAILQSEFHNAAALAAKIAEQQQRRIA